MPSLADTEAIRASAAHDALAALYSSQAGAFDDQLAEDLGQIPSGPPKSDGIDLGKRSAAAILAQRVADGSQVPESRLGVDFFTIDQPGYWQQDPISAIPIALGAHWSECRPFVLASTDQFRVPPPSLDSVDYASAYDEAKALGGDGVVTPILRSAEQTEIGTYWAYDGTPSLCAPPRLYNQVATSPTSDEPMWCDLPASLPSSTSRWPIREWRSGNRSTSTNSGDPSPAFA